MDFLRQTVNILADLLTTLIVLRVILSWIAPPTGWLSRFLIQSTEPILAPIRRATPRLGMMDFSPIFAFILIELIRNILNQLL